MFGSHLSIAGGLHNALIEARGLGMDCVQVFTKNQKQWKVRPLGEDEVAAWEAHRKSTGLREVVSHDSYLINLASPDRAMWEKSLGLFREELLRCEALGIRWLVTHPGAHMKSGEEVGLRRVAEALDRIHTDLPGLKTVTCLEITAGQGTGLGYRFEHLARIIELAREPERLAVCLDSAHLIEAGYDLRTASGTRAMLQMCDEEVGLERVKVWHVNDSKTPRGSRVDRHEHIGKGHIALTAFAEIVNHPAFRKVPKIMETPKGDAEDGRPWDELNLAKLKKLVRGGGKKRRGVARKK